MALRIVFMGTPEFAACSLRKLYTDGHDICGVFIQPDKPKNRGMKLTQSPVKTLALEHNSPVYQPDTLRDGDALRRLQVLSPELIVVVAYGKFLPPDILALPPMGCINVHGSILPAYRGAAPIQWAVLNGESETGVTIMHMAEAMDAGDIIACRKTPIAPGETSGALFDRLMVLGAELLGETIEQIADGSATRMPQNEANATYAPPLTKELSPVDWTKPAAKVLNQIHGLSPWPGATWEHNGKVFKLFAAHIADNPLKRAPGTVLDGGKQGLTIACGENAVCITQLQAPGKKRMLASDYLRGNPIDHK